jgi:syntaxin 18
MEISELHMIFATKVAEQEELANHIADNTIESKHNVDKGTAELHKAARRGVDFRIFVLLFLIVASLALLFLHWITN